MSKIIIIHPKDTSTDFLTQIVDNLFVEYILQRPNATIIEHKRVLSAIQECANELILFMGHGQSDSLHGAKGTEDDRAFEAYRKNFVNKDNISTFTSKIIISLSCNSNEKIGKFAIDAGVSTFVGFGYIPTDWIIEVEENHQVTSDEIDFFRSILVHIFSNAINYSLFHNFSIAQFERIFKVITNQKILELLSSNTNETTDWVIQNLYKLKDEIKVFGNESLLMIK
jgi:hypothetical protein